MFPFLIIPLHTDQPKHTVSEVISSFIVLNIYCAYILTHKPVLFVLSIYFRFVKFQASY